MNEENYEALDQMYGYYDEGFGYCPKCLTPLTDVPGIGPICPNHECVVIDDYNLPELYE